MRAAWSLPLTCEECCGGSCRFRPSVIRKAMAMIALILASDEDVSEAMSAYMAPWQGQSVGKGQGGFGPTDPAEWAWFVAELTRAAAAGCRTPHAAARFLCPIGVFDDVPEPGAY